jgi:hypothetical protein
MRTLPLGKGLIRFFKGLAGIWILIAPILPHALLENSVGATLSVLLFVVICGLLIWDFKKTTRKVSPYVVDGLILIGVSGLAGGIWGLVSSLLGSSIAHLELSVYHTGTDSLGPRKGST